MSTTTGHVVVVGCGRVGSGLADRLLAEGCTVTVIDRNGDAFRRLGDLPVGRVTGVGFDRSVLQTAGVERATALAAVTNGDNSNIVVARVARERFGVERVVARIYDPRRAAIYERLGITTIATVQWTTERVLHRLIAPPGNVAWTDPSARMVLVERRLPDGWAGTPTTALERDGVSRVVAVTRLGASSFPTANHLLQDGDVVHLAVMVDRLSELDSVLDRTGERIR